MRRKSVLQLGAAVLSVSFAMTAVNGNTAGVVLAAFESEEESTDTVALQVIENMEMQTSAETSEIFAIQETTATIAEQTTVEASNIPETVESEGIIEAEESTEGVTTSLEEMVEITLPKESVYVPISEFLPVEEEEKTVFLNSYNGYYVLHIKNDSEVQDVLYFNQKLKLSDIALYSFDSEKNTITNSKPVEDVMDLDEEKSILTLDLETTSDYVLVISNQLNDADFGYTSKFMPLPSEEAENEIETAVVVNAFVEETLPEESPEETAEVEETSISSIEESVTAAETTTDIPSEESSSIEESTETTEENTSSNEETVETSTEKTSEEITESESEDETESESESETESSSEEGTLELVSVKLELDQNLDTVPIAFLDYLDNSDVYSLMLTYSNGSERLLNKEDERYTVSMKYEDINDTEGILYRTYHITVKENSTGKIFEDSQSVEFGRKDPVDIKTEEMTTVIVKGNKWVMVQSTPSVTGRYSMNSDKIIESMYYAAGDDNVVCAGETFRLQQGVTYQFLIKLK